MCLGGEKIIILAMDGSAESGWTVYLENSSSSSFLFTPTIHDSFGVLHKDEHELDLSMVSDASSGPPIFPENYVIFPENEAIFPENETGSKTSRKMKGCEERRRRRRDRMDKTTSFLDDTASSDPNFNNSVQKFRLFIYLFSFFILINLLYYFSKFY